MNKKDEEGFKLSKSKFVAGCQCLNGHRGASSCIPSKVPESRARVHALALRLLPLSRSSRNLA